MLVVAKHSRLPDFTSSCVGFFCRYSKLEVWLSKLHIIFFSVVGGFVLFEEESSLTLLIFSSEKMNTVKYNYLGLFP